jgi:hypothetical protein
VTPANEHNGRSSSHVGAQEAASVAAAVVGDGTFGSFLQVLQNNDRATEQQRLVSLEGI